MTYVKSSNKSGTWIVVVAVFVVIFLSIKIITSIPDLCSEREKNLAVREYNEKYSQQTKDRASQRLNFNY